MKYLTPATLLSAAAVTSAALMGSCNNRDRSTTVAQSDTAPTEPVVRNGAVVAPQSGLTSSRDEVATSPATTRDRAAAPASSPTDTDARVAGAESPDPPTPAEPTRDQFVFDQNQDDAAPAVDTRYGRADAAPNSVERDPYAREDENPTHALSQHDARNDARQDASQEVRNDVRRDDGTIVDNRNSPQWQDGRDLPGSDSAREQTMGPSPTRFSTDVPVTDNQDLSTQRPPTDDRSPAINWDRDANRDIRTERDMTARQQDTNRDSTHVVTPDNSKAPDPPTPATPTRDSFQFNSPETARVATATGAATGQSREIDTEDDLWTSTDSRRVRSNDTTADQADMATRTTRESDVNRNADRDTYSDRDTSVAASVQAEDEARNSDAARDRDLDRNRTNSASRSTDAGNQPALYESGGQVYPVSPESRILAIIHARNLDEIALGRLALDRSASPQVQDYARELIMEHELADQRVNELASAEGYTLAEPALVNRMLAREHAARTAPSAHEHLKGLNGQAFDDAFVDHMTKGHAELITLMRHARPSIQDEAVYTFIEELIPTIEDHQTAAYQLTARF
jgi:predicted outer membrane protein